ncbi:MAG TPA: hypothetical protein VE988_24220 [Gemmataceae bacterium]|nr:hypothetical protein [Gemmataceae bacterium]
MWRVYLLAALIAAASGAISAYVTVKLTVPEPHAGHLLAPPPLTQKLTGSDRLEFPTGEAPSEKIIYYTIPFASPPNLTLTYGGDAGYSVADQTVKSFKLQRICPVKGKEDDWRIIGCNWLAEGLAAK